MTLQDAKLVLDWAKQKLDAANGSRISEPENYKLLSDRYNLVKNFYDKMCEDIVKTIVE